MKRPSTKFIEMPLKNLPRNVAIDFELQEKRNKKSR